MEEKEMTPEYFVDECWRLGAAMTRAKSAEALEALMEERRKLGEAYSKWHLKRYGWAYLF